MAVPFLKSKLKSATTALVASPSPLLRQGLRHLARVEPGLRVMAECAQADDLMPAIQRHNPDVVLVDQDLLSASDPGLLRRLLRWHPGLRVLLLLAGEPPDDYLGRAAAAGAAGFVLRQADTSLLVKALRAVASGRTWLQRELTERLVQDYARATTPTPADHQPALSRRQSQLLALLAQGLTNREIAQRLSLSEKTVKAHLTALYRKLGVSNRVGAARVALERSPGRPEAAERVT